MAHTAETKARIAAKVASYYAEHPEARQRQKDLHKAAWDPNTPEGQRRRREASERARLAQAKAQRDAIDAEIAQRILDGLLAPVEPEGGEQA